MPVAARVHVLGIRGRVEPACGGAAQPRYRSAPRTPQTRRGRGLCGRTPLREKDSGRKISNAVQLVHPRLYRALAPSIAEKLLYTRSLLNYGDKNGRITKSTDN